MIKKLVSTAVLSLALTGSTFAAQSNAVGGANPTPQAVGGANPTPQAVGGANPTPQAVGGANPTPQVSWITLVRLALGL